MTGRGRAGGQVVLTMLRLAYAADPRATVTALVLASVNALAVAGMGLGVREVAGSAGSGPTGLLLAAAVGAVAYAVIAAVQRVQHNIQVDLTERVDVALSSRLFALTSAIPTLEHLERADFLDRLRQVRTGTETLAGACWGAAGAVSSLLSLGLSTWLLVGVHPALVLLVLPAVPPLVFSRRASAALGRARDRTADADRREARLHRLATDAEAAKELRISGSDRVVGERATAYWEKVTTGLVHGQVRAAAWRAAGWVCFAAGYLAALAFVAHLVAQGRSGPGDLLMVASLSGYLRAQLQATVAGATHLAEGRHTMGHLRRLEEHAATARHPGTEPPPARLRTGISLRGIRFTYPGTDDPVLDGVDLDLPAGAAVALVGVNGAGKTTLVKLLTGMHEPSAGEVLVDGVPLRRLDLGLWRARITASFQDFVKFQVTAGHAVGLGDLPRADDRDAVARAIDLADARAVVDRLPRGVDSRLGRVFDGAELSHGQWQRLALGRAVMRRAPLLSVLDEPTAALDPQAEHDLYERFVGVGRDRRATAGAITLLVSHRFSTVRMADLIVVLAEGRVAERGTHEALMALGGRYAELYGTQSDAYTAHPDPNPPGALR
ncbi:ABC transporter ATP-binding protein [Saccharothrix algeriensis]|uniref:ABC transporter ATP-binding protein n=1 Tax=Saccharothrix algeriensis TaxID=173560 RepID=A0A8T8HW03_9PSEU|nr:ABC transporter ATP-binding protein [Saccharothrix algeriensis]MBM7814469.1 ATP-binding cassette subfamily B protein [Saccharothrix algeriensis]QTR02765.1 ABC transporter ATP-binding protein [Saccharothrix algeriensis]